MSTSDKTAWRLAYECAKGLALRASAKPAPDLLAKRYYCLHHRLI
jgi:hypothetical protein